MNTFDKINRRTHLYLGLFLMPWLITVWKAGYAAPHSAAWHSSLSPVLASLDLFDVKIGHARRFSRVFLHQDHKNSLLEGIDPEWLIRWNGFPGTVGLAPLEGPAMNRAGKLLWAREPGTTLAARLRERRRSRITPDFSFISACNSIRPTAMRWG